MDKEKIINRIRIRDMIGTNCRRKKGLGKDGIGITIQTIRDLVLAKARIEGNVR